MEMTPDKWKEVKVLFEAALDKPSDYRLQFLEDSCTDDRLRAEVARLLAEYEDAGSFLSKIAARQGDQGFRNGVEHLLANQNFTNLTGPLDNSAYKLGTELVPGETLAQYQIEEKLGQGGMGAVYRAHDTRLLRTVVLKVLTPEHIANAEKRRRLMLEARAASALNHSNIVTVYEIGSDRDVDFIAMEYVQGQSLACRIPQEGLPLGRALDYAIQIAGALANAHSEGVIHRDLKPANVMLTSDSRVKLLDFGLAQRSSIAEPHSSLTTENEICGTIGYMSPEQVRGLPFNCRTDLFSFGVVLYEMVTGERPFTGSSAMAVLDATLHAEPRGFNDRQLPATAKAIILKLLEKDPANRYESAEEVQRDLKSLESSLAPVESVRLSRNAWIAVGFASLLLISVASWLWHRTSRQRWALETAAPEIKRLVDAEEYIKAASLTEQALRVLPNDQTLQKLWIRATGEVSIASDPSEAEVSIRPYRGDPKAWETIGKTPLQKTRVAQGDYVWRIAKPGFAPLLFIDSPAGVPPPGAHSSFDYSLKLRPAASVPPGMVVVPGGWVSLNYPLSTHAVKIDDFLIDRNEVTNEEYKRFVDAGGYRKHEFWKQPFVRDGRAISWEVALPLFRDATGRPGPATWELSDYPKGHEHYPVAGISWYEAAAYAEFAGKSLPTSYHWMLAAQATDFTPLIAAGSNFRPEGTQPVGSVTALSGFGTNDMAGNVKEWTLNEKSDGKRIIMGGGFGEPNYMFYETDAQSPWDRRPNFGVRCAKFESPANTDAGSVALQVTIRDYWNERPVSNDVFKAYTALYAYDKAELNAQVEETTQMENWSREKVTFDAAYGHERVTVYLFLPKHSSPPFQTVVFFPGAFAFLDDQLDLSGVEDNYEFLMNSGRALMVPIYKGMYQRRDGLVPGNGSPPGVRRDHEIAWSKDLGRSLDYLGTRKDIDSTKLAYLGLSVGAGEGAHLLAMEERIKAAILDSGGLQPTIHYLPEGDPFNFVKHVTVPVLMLNGRYDDTFPLQTSQLPLFQLLGTPAGDKKHVIYEGGHGVLPSPAAVRESLEWLDKYLGPVRH
jgi:serine/threonine protein kinase/dienelactone hydrolase